MQLNPLDSKKFRLFQSPRFDSSDQSESRWTSDDAILTQSSRSRFLSGVCTSSSLLVHTSKKIRRQKLNQMLTANGATEWRAGGVRKVNVNGQYREPFIYGRHGPVFSIVFHARLMDFQFGTTTDTIRHCSRQTAGQLPGRN